MKVKNIVAMGLAATVISCTANAAEIPRESTPFNADEQSVVITESIIGSVLDRVESGELGYTEAAGIANTLVRKAVIAGETQGYGYGILSAITQNAILDLRDMYLRPNVYAQAEEEVKSLISDLIEYVKNGGDLNTAIEQAYIRIYQCSDINYVPDNTIDPIYGVVPAADTVKFNRARKLLNEAKN